MLLTPVHHIFVKSMARPKPKPNHWKERWTLLFSFPTQFLCLSGMLIPTWNLQDIKIDLEFYFSGFVAERMNLRYFLSIGMILSGVLTFLFGFAKVMDIHSIYYFVTIQVSISYSLGPLCFWRYVFSGFCWCLSVIRLAWCCHCGG